MSPDVFPPELICVLDSSTLFDLKYGVKYEDQWRRLTCMSRLLASGHLTYPKQVADEAKGAKWPDAPGIWIWSQDHKVRYSEPAEHSQAAILAVAPKLVEEDETRDTADPYVVAMAFELATRYLESRVVVASNDTVDRLPRKSSIRSACTALGIEFWESSTFVRWLETFDET